MGPIEDEYADIETEVSEAEFREAVEQKLAQMDELMDERSAAMLVAQELADSQAETVADIEAGMDEVQFVAKVVSVGEVRSFEREDTEGRVLNVDVADETGSVRLAFWDGRAVAASEELEKGDVLRVGGSPSNGYSGVEVSVSDAEPADVEVDVSPGEGSTVDALRMGQSDVALTGQVLDTGAVRTFDRDDGSEGRVANITLGDETGRIQVTLWDERAPRAEELSPGATVEIVDGYVRERDGDIELHVGDQGRVDEVDASVAYEPEATPIEAVELGENADIAGVVRSADPVRTFERDDGSEGQVRNVRLQDDSGDIRVALWGEKADRDIAPGDELLVADAEIQDGWQDDLEASAGWRSTLAVLEDASVDSEAASTADTGRDTGESTAVGDSGEDAVSDGGATGLDAFADGTSPETAETGTTAADTGGDRVEFTGTVVQTGEPVVLDNSTETMPVETEATLRLGEEVTARGTVVDERLDADEIL
ncbi:MAG: replication factor A [halophilic archaeon J07HX64]|jgi:Single-stranded DNA-binding replication protein A (RPA), large (70 kD) subunit and related ssDNA-binding proteins|nr:MAG: replication factor A [halophilic archaeon J07HX64]